MKLYQIYEIADINKNSLKKNDGIKNIEYLDTSSLTENQISGIQSLNRESAPSRAQRKVQHNTILYSTVRPNQKHYGILKNPSTSLIVSTGFATIDIKDEFIGKIDPDYLFLLLSRNSITEYLQGIAQNSVSSYPSINPSDIGNLKFTFPESLEEQKRIAKVLTDIDSKIAVNKKINKELETMAKELYDYWFVQFDFPNAEGKPYKTSGGKMVYNEVLKREIPEGWEVKSVFDVFDVQYGFPFDTELFTEEKTNIPIVRIRDILENTVSAYSTEITDEKYHLYKKDLLIGMDGNFHMNYWSDDEAYLNQRSVRLRRKEAFNVSTMQGFFELKPIIKAKEARAKGSTVGHLSDKDMKEINVMIPKFTNNFDPTKQFEIILDKKMICLNEIKELTKLRDELLPLLMNGQVTVKE